MGEERRALTEAQRHRARKGRRAVTKLSASIMLHPIIGNKKEEGWRRFVYVSRVALRVLGDLGGLARTSSLNWPWLEKPNHIKYYHAYSSNFVSIYALYYMPVVR